MHIRTLGAALSLALSAGPALATVTINPAGTGEGLLYPFFTTYHGQSTLLTLANDTDQAKALKVRVMESWGGRETLTFNLYLAPNATWKALLGHDDASSAAGAFLLQNNEPRCTVPTSLAAAMQPLLTHGYQDDEGPQDAGRTREGYVEVVEMGVLDAELGTLASAATGEACATLQARHQPGGAWRTSPNAGLGSPSGGLQGEALIINTAEGTTYGYPALAFNGLSTGPRQRVLQDDSLGPRLDEIETPPLGQGTFAPISVEVFDSKRERQVLRYPSTEGHQAISALLATGAASGGFEVHSALAARTEWVVSFPTRRAHDETDETVPPAASFSKFAAPFSGTSRCETVALSLRKTDGDAIADADIPQNVSLCGSVDILRFESDTFDTGPIFAREDNAVQPGDAGGRATLDFAVLANGVRRSEPDLDGRCWSGLPAWVLPVAAYENHDARPGLMAYYSTTGSTTRAVDVVDCNTLD